MKTIGLTGGSGAGKSVVAEILRDLGGFIIDADKIAHEIILQGEPAYKEVLQEFGSGVLFDNGDINRKALSEIVFSDMSKKAKLEKIMHKYILKIMYDERDFASTLKDIKFAVFDAPLLFESGLDQSCDITWFVDAPLEQRTLRICKRDNISKEDAIKRINAQTKIKDIEDKSDIIIKNDMTIDDLRKRVTEDINKFLINSISDRGIQ